MMERAIRRQLDDDESGDLPHDAVMAEMWARGMITPQSEARAAFVPRDRIYLSNNEGRTWRAATCPGDLHGACPAFTVDNIFGAGASYAFVGDGVYRFHGGGPAEQQLPLSAHLPFRHLPVRVADLLGVSAGIRDGDPIYVLAKGARGALQARLWRSTDGGRSWQELLLGPFPVHRLT